MGIRILVADDESTLRSVIARVLRKDGYEVEEAASGEEALEKFREHPFPLIVSDIVMGKMTGLELLEEVKQIDPETLVVVMTSHASLDTAAQAVRSGAYDYLIKPFEDLGAITGVVNRAKEQIRLTQTNAELMGKLKDYTEELESVNEQLQLMAHRDGLTGLYNHRYFRDALAQEISRCTRHRRTFSLVFMDIDHFKNYNDTCGHLAGDELLRQLARLIESRCRSSSMIARYGGEEFVILAPETEKQGALTLAERVRRTVEEHAFSGAEAQPGGRVTMSLGVSTFPEDGKNEETLIDHADQALYQAKHGGRNRVVGWQESGSAAPEVAPAGKRR